MAWQCHARGFPTHKQLLVYTRTVIHDLKNTEIGNFTGHYGGFAATTVLCKVLQFPIHNYTTLLGQRKTFVLLLLAINCPSFNLRRLIAKGLFVGFYSVHFCSTLLRETLYLKK